MTEDERPAFAAAMDLMNYALAGGKMGKQTYAAYWVALQHLTVEELGHAATQAVRTLRFFPKPSELLTLAKPSSSPEEAWLLVANAASRIGSYESVDFADPAINAAIRSMGGWIDLCFRQGDAFSVWARKDFLAAYAAFARAPQLSGEATAPLDGRIAVANANNFAELTPPPKRIGATQPALPEGET